MGAAPEAPPPRPVSRRDLFHPGGLLAGLRAGAPGAPGVGPTGRAGAGPIDHPPGAAIRTDGSPVAPSDTPSGGPTAAALPATIGSEARHGHVTIDAARCSACRCCVTACPPAALDAREDGTSFLLWFKAALCDGCGACAAACPERVIVVRPGADPRAIAAGRTMLAKVDAAGRRCASCGQPLTGGVAGDAIAARLAASHPQLAARLRAQTLCADCQLRAPGTGASF
ncbi:MAG: 4Fe-4S binding protein [Actinomycetia bacterium]|nr:4Fe-4S binding protein [Actinomycetes bacterium]